MTVVKFISANKKTLRWEGSSSGNGLRPGSGDAPAPLGAPGPPAAGRMRHAGRVEAGPPMRNPFRGETALRSPSARLTLVLGEPGFIVAMTRPSKKMLAVGGAALAL